MQSPNVVLTPVCMHGPALPTQAFLLPQTTLLSHLDVSRSCSTRRSMCLSAAHSCHIKCPRSTQSLQAAPTCRQHPCARAVLATSCVPASHLHPCKHADTYTKEHVPAHARATQARTRTHMPARLPALPLLHTRAAPWLHSRPMGPMRPRAVPVFAHSRRCLPAQLLHALCEQPLLVRQHLVAQEALAVAHHLCTYGSTPYVSTHWACAARASLARYHKRTHLYIRTHTYTRIHPSVLTYMHTYTFY